MKCGLWVLLFIQVQYTYGQIFGDREKDKIFNLKSNNRLLIGLDNSNTESIILKGIRAINVIDARADTFALGYLKKGILRTFKKIQFSTPGLTAIQYFSKGVLAADPVNLSSEILLVVKELWLSEEDTDYDSKDKIQDVDEKLYPESHIKVKLDFYLKKDDAFYPLYRFDSSLTKTLPLKDYASEHIQDALHAGIAKIQQYNLANIPATKTALTLSDILHYNDGRFGLSILKDTVKKMGVYASYEDFKANSPSIEEYEIKRGKLGDELYTKSQDGRWLVTRSAWGYCDGSTCYIKSGENYFELIRVENSYYFYGSKVLSRAEVMNNSYRRNNYGSYDYQKNSSGIKSYRNLLSPLKLNIETGTIY